MFIKILIISIILMALVMMALGIKMLFNSKAVFPAHSCNIEDENTSKEEDCDQCEINDIVKSQDNINKK